MNKVKVIFLVSICIFQSFLFSDVTSSITSLVGKNAQGYLSPLGTMMGTGMNSGFYRKATPHKILGFDLTLDIAYALAPPGQTTYNFIIPDDSISFPFQFQFPKSLLTEDLAILGAIPTAGVSDAGAELYQDQTITFGLAVSDMLDAPKGPSQNILGSDSSSTLTVTLDNAVPQIFSQVVSNTWSIAKNIPGLGTEYTVTDPNTGIELTTLQPLYTSESEFSEKYGAPLDTLIRSGLGNMDMPTLPIPGGFGDTFKKLPFAIGFPTPIFQASVGLPFHTELTIRGFPQPIPIPGIGSIQYGGFGGKIGISEFFKKKPEKKPKVEISPKLTFVLEELPTNITPADVDSALAELRNSSVDLTQLDTLNYRFQGGDPDALLEIRSHLETITQLPKQKKQKPKGWPIDLSLGYYQNDMLLDFSGATLNSVNRMYSLQAGKTFNLPWFLAFLGGLGIYGGLGYETSSLDIGYELANPLAYGCFSGSGNNKTYLEGINEDNCSGTKTWSTGVPTNISLDFPGDNKFRSLIGMRLRVLFIDAYVDYNMGTSNAINAGLGITFR